jgi:hypothetical protein
MLDVEHQISAVPSREGFHVFDIKNKSCIQNFPHLKYTTLLEPEKEEI